jgi:hypothetical protein
MIRHQHPRTAGTLLTLALLLAALPAAPTAAVSGGQYDTANAYPNVGRLEVRVDGEWRQFCSGTLIAPDVVLTAAHCAWTNANGVLPPSQFRVNFNPAASGVGDPDDPSAYVTAGAVVPGDFDAPHPPSMGKNQMAEPWNDIALVWLAEPVVGIAPAPVAGPGYLDAFSVRQDSFTVVGYGLNGFLLGSGVAPVGAAESLGRQFRDDVVLLGHDLYPDRYVKISEANCFGDSGGPLLHQGTVVGITVWTDSARCAANGMDFRVDSAIAQAFLNDHL